MLQGVAELAWFNKEGFALGAVVGSVGVSKGSVTQDQNGRLPNNKLAIYLD